MRKLIGSGLLVLAVSAPTVAADLGVTSAYKAPDASPVVTWTGSYVGITSGGTWGRGVVTDGATGIDVTSRFNASGGIFGVASGFNYQTGRWVLGYEGDASFANKSGSALEVAPFGTDRHLAYCRGADQDGCSANEFYRGRDLVSPARSQRPRD